MEFSSVFFLLSYYAVLVKGQARDSVACYFWDAAIYHHGNCYKYFQSGSVKRREAEIACAAKTSGGKLAEVFDEKQLQDLMGLPWSGSAWLAPSTTVVGDDDFSNPSTATSELDIPDSAWDTGQPFILPVGLFCLMIRSSGFLGSKDCVKGSANGYICQQEVDNVCDVQLPGSVYFQGSCFLYKPERLNYTMAHASCAASTGFLTEPITPQLFNFVRDIAAQHPGNEWIGGQARLEHNYTMTWWKSGMTVSSNKSYWASNPANEVFMKMVMSESHSNLFKTNPDYKLFSHICQYDAGNPCEWFYPGSVYADGYCLKLHTRPLTWCDAKKLCKKDGSLVEMTSDAIYHAANQLAKQTPSPENVFIGLSDHATEGVFKWVTSGAVVTSPKWADDQPRNDDFVAIAAEGFDWIVLDKGDTAYFICQKAFKKTALHTYSVPLPDLNRNHDHIPQETYLHVLSSITSHKVYIKVMITSPLLTSSLRYFVTHDEVLRLDLPKEAYSDMFGINPKRIKVYTTHPVAITLFYILNGVKGTTLLHTPLHSKTIPSSFFVSTSGFARNEDEIMESQIAVLSAQYPVDLTFRFPGHVIENARLSIGGMDMNLTGDMQLRLKETQTAILRLTGGVDGVFIYSSQLVMVMYSSVMKSPTIPIDIAHVISHAMPSELMVSYYVSFPSIASDDVDQKHFLDYYTVINLADDNKITVKGVTGVVKWLDLPFLGMVKTFDLPTEEFFTLQGPHPYYLTKHVHWEESDRTGTPSARAPCRANIVPRRLWRRHYILAVTPDPEMREVRLYVIVPEPFQTYIMIDGVLSNITCNRVVVTMVFGCHVDLTDVVTAGEGKPHHVNIQDFASTFGAYVTVTSDNAIRCQFLGIIGSVTAKEKAISLDSVYQTKIPTTVFPQMSTSPNGKTAFLPPPSPKTPPPLPPLPSPTNIITATPPTLPFQSSPGNQSFSLPTTTTTFFFSRITTSIASQNPNPAGNLTEEERLKLLFEIEEQLKIDARSTSAFKRRKTSADDVRTSSTAIGLVGVAVMAIVFGFILCSDVISAISAIYHHCGNFGLFRKSFCRRPRGNRVS